METIFKPNVLVSCLHAADAATRGLPLVDPRLAEAIRLPAAQLAGEIAAAGLPAARFWRHLIPLAASIENRRQLAEMAIIKTSGRMARLEQVTSAIAASIAAIENAVGGAIPDMLQELELRSRPIREQWEARGPGMLKQIGVLTDEALLVPRCEVLLVHPALGGAGEAHLTYNQVRLEAVLANALPELPEVTRLAWLIAQLQLDLPANCDQIHADRLPHVARFAMLPPVLTAAEYVDLAKFTPETLRYAIEAWRLNVPASVNSPAEVGQSSDLSHDSTALSYGSVSPALLMQWWETYLQTRPPWPVALTALDQMIG